MKRVVAVASAFILACVVTLIVLNQTTPQLPAPAGSTVTRQTWRASLGDQFPDLRMSLGLTPEQAEQFLDLLARQQADLWNDAVDIVIGEAEDPATRLEWQRKLVQQLRANQAELIAAFGDKYTKWLEYQAALSVRQQIDHLRARLGSGDIALQSNQVEPLVAALMAEQSRLEDDLRAWDMSTAAADSVDLLDEHTRRRAEGRRRLLSVASSWLNAPQQEEYGRVLDLIATREAALKRVVGLLGTAPVQPRPALVTASD
jgi:hypothetical protein